jgi:hypothetical protein
MPKVLSPQALRALNEAQERHKDRDALEAKQAALQSALEIGGPKGLEPTRYNDWERKGIAYDF